ncbi:MAG: hypothetical protein WA064_05305 [Candidatus Moraniibacteriota bacterium]
MVEELTDGDKKRVRESLEMTKDPRFWMNKTDDLLFAKSGKKTPTAWIESLGFSADSWIKAKRDAQAILRPNPRIPPKLTPLPTLGDIKKERKGQNKNRNREFKLLEEYTTITPAGRKITIIKLSRPFIGDEEDLHRCKICEDSDVRECIDFAIKIKVNTFSCVHCQFFELLLT